MADIGLAPEDRKFLEERIRRHDKFEKAIQVVDVIEAMSSLGARPAEEAKLILEGTSQAKTSFVVNVVKAYRQEKPKKSIVEFFNERYKAKASALLKPADAIQEAIRGSSTRNRVENSQAVSMEDFKRELESESKKIREDSER